MTASTTTSWASAIPTETLDALILSYLRGATFLPSLVRSVDLSGIDGLTHDFNSFGALTAAATTQGADLTPAELSISGDGSVTAAEIAVAVEIPRIVRMATAASITDDDLAREVANAIAAKLETDITATFASATNEVGSTGVDLSLENFEDAVLKLRQANAPTVVPPNFNLPPALAGYQFVGAEVQVADLARALRQAGMTFATAEQTGIANALGSAGAAQLRGSWLGVKIYGSNYAATVNSGADKSGAMFCPAAIGLVTKGGPIIDREAHTLGRSQYVVGSQVYGVGLIKQAFAVEVITDA